MNWPIALCTPVARRGTILAGQWREVTFSDCALQALSRGSGSLAGCYDALYALLANADQWPPDGFHARCALELLEANWGPDPRIPPIPEPICACAEFALYVELAITSTATTATNSILRRRLRNS